MGKAGNVGLNGVDCNVVVCCETSRQCTPGIREKCRTLGTLREWGCLVNIWGQCSNLTATLTQNVEG